jgi:hypothetical protein
MLIQLFIQNTIDVIHDDVDNMVVDMTVFGSIP